MRSPLQLALLALSLCLSSFTFADRQASDDERLVDDPRVQHRSYAFPRRMATSWSPHSAIYVAAGTAPGLSMTWRMASAVSRMC